MMAVLKHQSEDEKDFDSLADELTKRLDRLERVETR